MKFIWKSLIANFQFAIQILLTRVLEKKKRKGDSELNALNAQNFQVNISNRNFAICSGKDSKDGNSNRRGKSTKLNAAFKG